MLYFIFYARIPHLFAIILYLIKFASQYNNSRIGNSVKFAGTAMIQFILFVLPRILRRNAVGYSAHLDCRIVYGSAGVYIFYINY